MEIVEKNDFKRRGCLIDVDLVDYEMAWDFQRELVAAKLTSDLPDTLMILEHNPVITLGRRGNRQYIRASPGALTAAGINIYHVERGGEVTYHGPGQIVGYPILDLRNWRRDVSWYVFNLEEVLMRTLGDFGIEGARNRLSRGVWVGESKSGSIGVAIKRWVTSHGFSLNISPNMNHYSLITPCGLDGIEVTCMRDLLGREPDHHRIRDGISRHFQEVFHIQLANMDMEELKMRMALSSPSHEKLPGGRSTGLTA